ncbi:MAG: XRE family transcriptional regulator [Deltaproteobacteria bacterium]|nr:XRE family transcriptional regulator [Deltaproteobacteria bacterium]
MVERIKIEKGSGNVFRDLNLPDAEGLLAKAELAAQIGAIVARKGLTQVQAARLLGIDQPKVSALMHGRLSGFSTDRLLRFLNALGREVRIVVGARAAKHPRIRVMCA